MHAPVAAEDAELMLHADDIRVAEIDVVGRLLVVGRPVAVHDEPDFIGVFEPSRPRPVDGHHYVSVGRCRVGYRLVEVAGERRNSAPSRHVG